MVAIRADRWRGNLAESLGVSGRGHPKVSFTLQNRPRIPPFFHSFGGGNKRLEERCWNTWNQRSFPSKFSSRKERRRSRILLIRDTLTSSRVPRPSRIEEDWNAAYYKHRVISMQTLLIRVNFKDIATLDSGYSFP